MDTPQYGSYPPAEPVSSDLPPRSAAPTTGPALDHSDLMTPPQPAPKKSRRKPLVIAAVVGVLALAAGIFALTSNRQTPLEAAKAKCSTFTSVTDEGKSISFRNVLAKENPGPEPMDKVDCFLAELKIPSSVKDHIGQTRALDGMQNDSWGDFNARWNYHPDNGMNLTITLKD
ncbi:hypothetical protein GCM10009817_39790 [Terrabacter lapilli]|uniref:Uncharacterized protein n=1 Tax=Terrabacter lapilli TaxID=436231 RepID=A0ABP5EA43_9MICO